MNRFNTINDLPWRHGFGGVLKAEVDMPNGSQWTVLHCDDNTFTMYGTHPRANASPTFEDVPESKVVGLLNFLSAE